MSMQTIDEKKQDATINLKDMDQIWCAYNHMPYGNVCATHFETVVRRRHVGDGQTEDVVFTAEQQYKGFLQSEHVACYIDGKLEKNRAIVYVGSQTALKNNPRAAQHVIEWALGGGLAEWQPPQDAAKKDEVAEMKNRISGLEAGQQSIADAIKAQAESISALAQAIAAANKGK